MRDRTISRKSEEGQVRSGYAPVNGLQMYYEIYGTGQPLVLLHGAFSAIGTSFGLLLPVLSQNHQVIAVELQGHGRTADINRPLTIDNLADDVVDLLDHLDVQQADIFGYSLGAGVALQVAIRHADRVRKLVLVSLTINKAGYHPGLAEGMAALQPEQLHGSPFYEEYARLAPRPEDFPRLVEKVKEMDANIQDWPDETFGSVQAPALIMIGDSDIMRPEHAVEMFRLLGGGQPGDMQGLPKSQLAVLPGTTHVTIVQKSDLLPPMIESFLKSRGVEPVCVGTFIPCSISTHQPARRRSTWRRSSMSARSVGLTSRRRRTSRPSTPPSRRSLGLQCGCSPR